MALVSGWSSWRRAWNFLLVLRYLTVVAWSNMSRVKCRCTSGRVSLSMASTSVLLIQSLGVTSEVSLALALVRRSSAREV